MFWLLGCRNTCWLAALGAYVTTCILPPLPPTHTCACLSPVCVRMCACVHRPIPPALTHANHAVIGALLLSLACSCAAQSAECLATEGMGVPTSISHTYTFKPPAA